MGVPLVRESADEYVAAISSAVAWRSDAIGYVAWINGAPDRADLYYSHDLFRALWPKLLRACAVEAVARRDGDRTYPPPPRSEVDAFVSGILCGTAVATPVTGRITLLVRESEQLVTQETLDAGQHGWCLHRSCLSKHSG
jgi:hypothetical protein